jgi:hypothetical protein
VFASDVAFIIVGASLPWVDGAQYLGIDPTAPRLLLPTTQTLRPHPALVERALRRQLSVPTERLALLAPRLVVPMPAAGAPSTARLEQWLAAEAAS